ncbi:hypothetical protein PLICRDRAFT_62454, partial [Plicaturopsis crispa FD-325 SS-3]
MASTRAKVVVEPLTYSDLPAAAKIYFACFNDFPATLFEPEPAPLDIRTWRTALRFKLDIESGRRVFVKAVLEETGDVVGFAIWQKPGVPIKEPSKVGERTEEENEAFRGINVRAWHVFHSAGQDKRIEIFGDEPHWYLYILAVLPQYQNQGVGSQLLDWGITAADAAEPKRAVYLEASPVGQKLYERRGFETV